MKLCIDLCSGYGGFSQAFQDKEGWEVVTIDIKRRFKPTIVADVVHLPLRDGVRPDALLMSPPCQRFSVACPQWPKHGIMKALQMVGACLEAVVKLKPEKWLLENPRGRLRWFLGKPRQTIRYSDYDISYVVQKVTDFWGNILFPMVKGERRIKVGHISKGWGHIVSRSRAKRSLIPRGVSEAVFEGVNRINDSCSCDAKKGEGGRSRRGEGGRIPSGLREVVA